MSELSPFGGSEEYGACGDDARRALLGPTAPVSPWYPLSRTRLAAVQFKKPPNLKAVTVPVRCPACRYCIARAALPPQTWEDLQFNDLSQCRTCFSAPYLSFCLNSSAHSNWAECP